MESWNQFRPYFIGGRSIYFGHRGLSIFFGIMEKLIRGGKWRKGENDSCLIFLNYLLIENVGGECPPTLVHLLPAHCSAPWLTASLHIHLFFIIIFKAQI